MSVPVQHLYIHVPFCKGFCAYCPFYKETYDPALTYAWINALKHEIKELVAAPPLHLHSIYMGGGTPSILEVSAFSKLSELIHEHSVVRPTAEWTVEANPESINATKVEAWAAAGVTRVSLGVQSLHANTLRRMNRLHDVQMVYQAIEILRRFSSLSFGIDLIAGFPELLERDWRSTLEMALALEPDHISVYECTLHACTPLYQNIVTGVLDEVQESSRDRALQISSEIICNAGYEHYETSNFCRPGKHCRHNMAVWRGEDYLGLGPSAASRIGLKRWTNQPDLAAYIESADSGVIPREIEHLSPVQDATERLMFAFRLRSPVKISSYLPKDDTIADKLRDHWEKTLASLDARGLVRRTGEKWLSTAKGQLWADHIAEALLP